MLSYLLLVYNIKYMNIRYTLITGASYGIGLALAKEFAKFGHNLILISRQEKVLQKVAMELSESFSVQVQIIEQDLSIIESAKIVFNICEKNQWEVENLINNAGFGNYGFFAETDILTDINLISLNVITLTYLTKLFLPKMINNKKGKILNVASMASFLPGPFMNTYFASKSYVLSFSEALHEEVHSLGITVSCVCPGPTESNFGKRANYKFSAHDKIKMTAEYLAKITYRGFTKNKTLIIPGWNNKFIYYANLFVPRGLKAKLVKRYSGYKDY
jgi:uncharacterized protein